MFPLITPPPSSSPVQFILESPAAAPRRASSKRKKNQPDLDGSRSAKRQARPRTGQTKEDKVRSSDLLCGDQINCTQAGAQPTPPVPVICGNQQQQHQVASPASRNRGKPAAKKLYKAATVKSPRDDFQNYQYGTGVQLAPSDPAQPPPPPHSNPTHGHGANTASSAGTVTHHDGPLIDPRIDTAPQPSTVQSQHHTDWLTGPSKGGPRHAMSQSQVQLPTEYDLLRPLYKFSGHSQPYPVFQQPSPGTVSHPIVLDDTSQNNTSNTSHALQQPPPSFSQGNYYYSRDYKPSSRENTENKLGVDPSASISQALPINIAKNPLRPISHLSDEAGDYALSVWRALNSTSALPEPLNLPYGFLDQHSWMFPSTLSKECRPKGSHGVPQASRNYQLAIPTPSLCEPVAKAPVQKAKAPKKPALPTDEPSLCPEQAALVDLIMQGHNVFYTGSAGCGKSTVLKAFVKKLSAEGKTVCIVAPTGRAALNVGGITTWTFAGWTPNSHKKGLERLKQEAMWSTNVNKRLKGTDVLVIDEISMVENLHFERLNEIMKAVPNKPHVKDAAFGGCQLVVTGDFCQLPPVKPFQHCIQCGNELARKMGPEGLRLYFCKRHGEYADEDKWAFRSKAWEECDFKNIHLRTIHRQTDEPFIRMLQKCRLGSRLSEPEISLLMNHKSRTSQAMELYPTRKEAEDVNWAKFNKIAAEAHTYWAHDSFFWHKEQHPKLQWKGTPSEWRNTWNPRTPQSKRPLKALDEHRYNECVQLKKGGLVVLLTNLDLKLGLCNGSQGIICGFEDYDPAMMPTRDTRGELSWDKKKSDKVEPKPGQRVLRGEHAGIQEREIKNFITSECAPIKRWPIVRFHNGQKCTVYAECSITQLGDEEPYSLLSRTQLPLAPAWAMTIHKSQSLTLDRVIVNLDRAFEEGQVYVALSRATGLSGLKIEGNGQFLRDKIMVNAEVASFLKEKFGDIYGAMDADAENPETVEAS